MTPRLMRPLLMTKFICTEKAGNTAKEGAADTSNISKEFTKALNNAGGYDGSVIVVSTSNPVEPVTSATVAAAYTSKDKDGAILINRNDGQDFFLEAFDGLAGSGLGLVHKEVDALSDLPVRGPDGFRVAVRGSADANEDDYYLRFETNDGQSFGEGGWVEDVGPDLDIALDPTPFPSAC